MNKGWEVAGGRWVRRGTRGDLTTDELNRVDYDLESKHGT